MKKAKSADPKKSPEPVEEPSEVMEVFNLPVNQRVLIARDSNKQVHTVEVGQSATFVYGDLIEVKPHPTQGGIFKLISAVPRDRRRPLPTPPRKK